MFVVYGTLEPWFCRVQAQVRLKAVSKAGHAGVRSIAAAGYHSCTTLADPPQMQML